ncbi:Heterogeneous nuclear ribonucleoprotein U-like protein 1 [Geodia barretti]|uniref:Heterogeneous nuclear ribonucleoprotein U-like protein 1 n=1 Tax=Geodia barretti TaxID=519541 RepID=A0AA35W4C3_GEOBA|nr:Heterogeneous nuclear ribonucleoprotein U-like protein 1 [Geodia barretti]
MAGVKQEQDPEAMAGVKQEQDSEAMAEVKQEQDSEAMAEVKQEQDSEAKADDEQATHERVEEGDEVVVEDEVGGETEEEAKEGKDNTMDTTADSTTESASVAGTGGGEKEERKRPREDDDRRKDSRDRHERPDPTKAPDPEDPSDDFSEESVSTLVQGEGKFQPPDGSTITLDNFNSDLYFKISPDGVTGHGLSQQGFAYLWAAAKATWGARGGKVCYEVKILEYITVVDLADTEEHPNALRVGWSTGDSGLDLGEAPLSYGYGCTGKAVVNNQYIEYGEPYGDGDVITCLLVGVYIITNLNNYFSP